MGSMFGGNKQQQPVAQTRDLEAERTKQKAKEDDIFNKTFNKRTKALSRSDSSTNRNLLT